MEKLKISKNDAEILEFLLKNISKDELLKQYKKELDERDTKYNDIRKIPYWELAKILINGYEILKTPEQELRELYIRNINLYNKKTDFDLNVESGEYESGFIEGVSKTLKILNIKIKGIND